MESKGFARQSSAGVDSRPPAPNASLAVDASRKSGNRVSFAVDHEDIVESCGWQQTTNGDIVEVRL